MPHEMSGLITFLMYAVGGLFGLYLMFKAIGFVVIGSDEMGIVEKRWSRKGSVKEGQIIAPDGEAGYQPAVLRTGLHLLTPIFYTVKKRKLITIGRGKIGYVFARDGKQMPATQLLGKAISVSFEDCAAWLKADGQKGLNRGILREGTYAINTAAFAVLTENGPHFIPMGNDDAITSMQQELMDQDAFDPVIVDPKKDEYGVVTVHDGPTLPQGDIIAPICSDPNHDHQGYQDPEEFLAAGGMRGRQLQTITEGTYYINGAFASVEMKPKKVIAVGNVGVITSYVGEAGADLSGAQFSHGELVENSKRGVCRTPLGPGKYSLNGYAYQIDDVPTVNVVLKWEKGATGEHGFDGDLTEVEMITKDGYDLRLPLAVVCHIDYSKASSVIQRFGDVKRLVNQTLDPFVSAYFRNIGQQKEAIQLLHERTEIAEEAEQKMREQFAEYDIILDDVLIGTPHGMIDADGNDPFAILLDQLQLRKLAEEQIKTFKQQQTAAEQQRSLAEAQAIAQQQTALTESNIQIERDRNRGAADLATKEMAARANVATAEGEKTAQVLRAEGESEAQATIAAGKAKAIVLEGEATATAKAKVGIAEGIAAKQKVAAYGGDPTLEVKQKIAEAFANAIREGGQQLVPTTQFIMGGAGGDFGAGSALQSLLGVVTVEMAQKLMSGAVEAAASGELDEYAERMTEEVLRSVTERPVLPEVASAEEQPEAPVEESDQSQ